MDGYVSRNFIEQKGLLVSIYAIREMMEVASMVTRLWYIYIWAKEIQILKITYR